MGATTAAEAMARWFPPTWKITAAPGGYDFGYYDGNRQFVRLGGTAENPDLHVPGPESLYQQRRQLYDCRPKRAEVIGCFHLQLNEHYGSFDRAASKAASLKIRTAPRSPPMSTEALSCALAAIPPARMRRPPWTGACSTPTWKAVPPIP